MPPPRAGTWNVLAAAAFRRLASTFRQVRRYRQLLLFLAAFWLYNDGIGTIIKMAIAYGDEVGIGRNDLITALVLTQFVGIPCTFLFGRLAPVLGTKRSILVGLGVYGLISVAGYFMQTALHFYILAGLVGMVQGGTQALSRSLFASMIPRARSAEFFGFYSTSSRFAGIFGPLVFGVVSQLTGGSRLGIVSLIFFFVAGGALLLLVDERREGARAAPALAIPVRQQADQSPKAPGSSVVLGWSGDPPREGSPSRLLNRQIPLHQADLVQEELLVPSCRPSCRRRQETLQIAAGTPQSMVRIFSRRARNQGTVTSSLSFFQGPCCRRALPRS